MSVGFDLKRAMDDLVIASEPGPGLIEYRMAVRAFARHQVR